LAAPERVQGLVIIGAGVGVAADPAAGIKSAERLRCGEFEQVVTDMADMVSHLPGASRDRYARCFHHHGACQWRPPDGAAIGGFGEAH
jgi:hypothetical protein